MNNRESTLNKARQLQSEGRLHDAISLLQKNMALMNDSPEAWHELGLLFVKLRDMKQARESFQKAMELDPQNECIAIHLGLASKALNDFKSAILHYEHALKLNPQSADAHHHLAVVLALENHYQEALRHYARAVQIEPGFLLAHYHLGLLFLQHEAYEPALKQFQNVLALDPTHLLAHFYLGVLQLKSNQLLDAETHFLHVLKGDEEHINALINLGVVYLKQNKDQLAIDYFTKALSFDPNNVEARNNLAATFIHHDRFENALVHYSILLKEEPNQIEYLYNAGVAQMTLGQLDEARLKFEEILAQDPNHFAALNNLSAIHSRLGDKNRAIHLLQHALQINPEAKTTQFMLNALTENPAQQQACPEYVSGLFDRYALYYDKHLQETLKYELPYKVPTLLRPYLLEPVIQNALDLGCGTGLMGNFLRQIAHHVVGVDLSSKMLSIARTKGVYDKLIEADILAHLKQENTLYSLMVAMDVLPYLGELESLFARVHEHLTPLGIFCFSTEISEDKPWKLQNNARFCHHSTYIHSLLKQHHFSLLHQEKVIARIQDSQPLAVIIYIAQIENGPQ